MKIASTGLLLVAAGIFAAALWWKGRHWRHEKGILPLSNAAIMIDDRGQPISMARAMRTFLAAWQFYLAFVLTGCGSAILISGV